MSTSALAERRSTPIYEQEGGWVSVRLYYGIAEPPLITDRTIG